MLYKYKSIKFLIFDRNVTFHNKKKFKKKIHVYLLGPLCKLKTKCSGTNI